VFVYLLMSNTIDYARLYLERFALINSILVLMGILRFILVILIAGSNQGAKTRYYFVIILTAIGLFLFITFSVKSLLRFYYFFECTLIPIFFLIMG
jgi:NADH:ubiquinone oxidoreductase subunit 4 (subunit M)